MHPSHFRPGNGEIRGWRNFILGVFPVGQTAFASWPFAIRNLPVKAVFYKRQHNP